MYSVMLSNETVQVACTKAVYFFCLLLPYAFVIICICNMGFQVTDFTNFSYI